MKRTLALAVSAVLGLGSLQSLAASPDQELAALDAQTRLEGQTFALRSRALNERIARGWSMDAVRAVMGEPERVQRSADGADQVEVWGYSGFEVRVQFRNGLVETWFVRFAQ